MVLISTPGPGIVVSADAEQIVTMRATAGRGELEAAGSLERHDLNKLASTTLREDQHPLDGGPASSARPSRPTDRLSCEGVVVKNLGAQCEIWD